MERASRAFFLLLLFIIWCSKSSAETQQPLPSDLTNYLQKMPEQALTVPVILQLGLGNMDAYKAVEAQLLQKDANFYEEKARELGTTLTVAAEVLDNENEPANSLSPTSIKTNELSAKLQKKFSTGTSVEAEISHGDSETTFISFPTSEFKTTEARIAVTQNLWNNFFGKRSKKRLQSGEEQSKAVEAKVAAETLDWMDGLRQRLYNAWLAQEQVRAAKENEERKKRLLKITRLQFRRGTSEEPDVLQVERNLTLSQLQKRDAQDGIEQIWRALVLSLKLPIHWLNIDPMHIPLKLDEPIKAARNECQMSQDLEQAALQTPEIQQLSAQKKASEYLLSAGKEGLKPSLDFSLGLQANGVDVDDRGETFSETISADHPYLSMNLTLTYPFEKYEQKAQIQRQLSQKKVLEAQIASAQSTFLAEYKNDCALLESWVEKVSLLKEVMRKQKRRNKLEEKRFRLGRGSVLNVIQAGDDATASQSDLNNAEITTRNHAWNVLRKVGQSKKFLEGLKK